MELLRLQERHISRNLEASNKEAVEITCYGHLGKVPDKTDIDGKRVKLTWLKSAFQLDGNFSEQDVRCAVRAYILLLIGGMLMPDKSSAMVHTQYLKFLTLPWEANSYSWGSAILSFLYREMCKASKTSNVDGRALNADIGGCMVLLQSWAWYRMSFIAPICAALSEFSLATRLLITEEPIQELGPDGSEIGLFTTPIDANADVDSNSSNDDDNPQQEQHHASTSIAHQPYQPPPHMYNIDMDALHVPEFPEMPNLGFSGSYGGLNDSELWIGMQFETIDQAKTAIKLYNIRKYVHSKVTRSTSEKYVLKIPAPDRFGWPYAESCIGKRFTSELQLLKLSFIFNVNGRILELTNLFPVYESCF
ncbi:hypothetical protein GQ457_07G002610 [Hibiscus cannabinus]